MRETSRFLMSASLLFALAAFVLGESLYPTPMSALIVVVPSPFDGFLIQTGDVKIIFRDGRSELCTHSGDCHNAKVSTRGEVGWIRMDKKSVDVRRMTLAGKDSLVVRLLDGTIKEFPPYDENVGIMDWRFADNGKAVIVRSMGHHGPSSYAKYEIGTGRVIDARGPSYTPYDKPPIMG
jgi:hypothetical protein